MIKQPPGVIRITLKSKHGLGAIWVHSIEVGPRITHSVSNCERSDEDVELVYEGKVERRKKGEIQAEVPMRASFIDRVSVLYVSGSWRGKWKSWGVR